MLNHNSKCKQLFWASFICLLLSGAAYGGDWGKVSDEEWNMGAPAAYPDANAVYLFSRCNMTIRKNGLETNYHYRIKILTKAGVEEANEVSIEYRKENNKIKNFKAQTITPDGKKHKVEKDAIFEKVSGEWISKTFTFPQLSEGCIIEYSYKLKSKYFFWLRPWYFQDKFYTMKSDLSVTLTAGFEYTWEFQNVPRELQKPVTEEHPDPFGDSGQNSRLKTLSWHRENLMPVKDEPYMGCRNDFRSSIRFQLISLNRYIFFSTWQELGVLMEKYIKKYLNKKKEIENIAKEVTAGATTEREKSRAIYDYVKSEFGTSDEFQTDYFLNKKVSKLFENKFGSGEEKNLLLTVMHRAVGIPAWPVMISTRERERFNPGFPNLYQFYYIIAAVQFDDQWEFLDDSRKHLPYGLLPPRYLVEGGLLLDGDSSDVVQMKIKSINSSRTDSTWMHISPEGSVSCSTFSRFTGYSAAHYGYEYDKQTPEEFIADYYLDQLNITTDAGDPVTDLNESDDFTLSFAYTTDDLVSKLDNNLIINPVIYVFRNNLFKSEKRFFPIDFQYPQSYANIVVITFDEMPADFVLPEDVYFDYQKATYNRKCHASDSNIVINTTIRIGSAQYSSHAYGGLKGFFDKVAQTSVDDITATFGE